MSLISGVIHQAVPSQTRVLPRDQLIEFQQVQKFGQVLAHQYCVRRFALHYPAAFLELRNIRTQIEAVLSNTQLTTDKPSFYVGQRITVTACCMRLLDMRKAQAFAEDGKKSAIRRLLERELTPAPGRYAPTILRLLTSADRNALSEIICDGCAIVSRLKREFNFFDYFDPFAMSSLVSAKTMLTHYLSAKCGHFSVLPWAARLSNDNHWLYTKEAERDVDMTGIVCQNAFHTTLNSNVRIFGHNQHNVSINGKKLENHLVLAVPTNMTPTRIDAMWREFRLALKEALIDNCGCYANVSTPEFDNSLFMRNYDERIFLVSETKQYRSKLYGLWMWDLVNPIDRSGLSISKAMDQLIPEAEALLSRFAPGETPYDSSTYKNYYDLAVKQITPKPNKRSRAPELRDLDYYLTYGMAILGRRPSVTLSYKPVMRSHAADQGTSGT